MKKSLYLLGILLVAALFWDCSGEGDTARLAGKWQWQPSEEQPMGSMTLQFSNISGDGGDVEISTDYQGDSEAVKDLRISILLGGTFRNDGGKLKITIDPQKSRVEEPGNRYFTAEQVQNFGELKISELTASLQDGYFADSFSVKGDTLRLTDNGTEYIFLRKH